MRLNGEKIWLKAHRHQFSYPSDFLTYRKQGGLFARWDDFVPYFIKELSASKSEIHRKNGGTMSLHLTPFLRYLKKKKIINFLCFKRSGEYF